MEAPVLPYLSATTWADPGQEDVRLVLRARRIRIDVRDEEGRSVADVEMHATRSWGDKKGWGFSRPRRKDHKIELWGRAGARDTVHLQRKGYLATERELVFDESFWTRDETIVIRADDGRRGAVALRLQREDGTWIRGLSARLRSASGSYAVRGFHRIDGDADDGIALPPGRWTLEILPTASFDDDYEGYDFPARGPLEIRSGERRSLSLVSRLGGRVRVHAKRGPGLDPKTELSVDVGLQVSPHLVDDPNLDYEDLGWLSHDTAAVSDIVEPGPWLLEIEGDGVRDELRPLVVRAGHTLDVHATLMPDSGETDDEDEDE